MENDQEKKGCLIEYSPPFGGKSPGWEPGKKRLRKNRCPIVKKAVTPPRKEPSVAV